MRHKYLENEYEVIASADFKSRLVLWMLADNYRRSEITALIVSSLASIVILAWRLMLLQAYGLELIIRIAATTVVMFCIMICAAFLLAVALRFYLERQLIVALRRERIWFCQGLSQHDIVERGDSNELLPIDFRKGAQVLPPEMVANRPKSNWKPNLRFPATRPR